MLAKNFRAINVTIPYKRDVIPFLDFVSDTAKSINAVNTIVNKNGKLYGYNTDFYGMTELINREGIEIADKKVLILGSGGTSSTACAVVKALNAKSVYTVSRSGGDGRITYEQAYKEHSDADVIINTTPVGMYPNPDDMPIDLGKFKMLSGVVDAVYNPLRTKLVLEAKKRGIKATGGLYMLVAQAARAVELFLDSEIDPKKTEEVYRKIKAQKQNIVLIGMPSSGKSTIGEKLAKRIEFDFVDTDEIIVNRAKMPITEIFKSVGEQGFRKLESEIIAEISKN
jgi:shikimate dehydrogenase